MQATKQDRNDPRSTRPRRVADRVPAGAPEPDDVVRWVAAGVVAAAALLGLLILVAIVAYALQPPGWLQMVLGVAMAAGAAVFAWLLAAALRKDDRPPQRRR